MIRRERDDHLVRRNHRCQRIEELPQVAVEFEQLIVELAGSGAPAMAHRIGCRQRHAEEVGAGAFSQPECAHPAQDEIERERIHHRSRFDFDSGHRPVRRNEVGEETIHAVHLIGSVVGLRIGARIELECPRRPADPSDRILGVPRGHPGRQRVCIPFARGEESPGEPVHRHSGTTDREDRAAILARDREGARVRVVRQHPVEEGGADEPPWRGTGCRAAKQRSEWIGNAEIIGDNADTRRGATGHHRGVARCRLRDGVVLLGIAEVDPFAQQPGEATAELGLKTVEIVGPQLVYHQRHDQSHGPLTRHPLGGDGTSDQASEEQEQQTTTTGHAASPVM